MEPVEAVFLNLSTRCSAFFAKLYPGYVEAVASGVAKGVAPRTPCR